MKFASLTLAGALAFPPLLTPQIVLIEPGHQLRQLLHSTAPLHPSQALLETTLPPADIESIAINPLSGDLFVQTQFPPGLFQSFTTHIFRVSPAGVVTPVALNTGFGINARGTDLQWYAAGIVPPGTTTPASLLLTQDQNTGRIVAVNAVTGARTTVAPFGFLGQGTFGAAVSRGAGGSDVPAGHLLFTSDAGANGIYSTPLGGPVRLHALPFTPGDDMVVQPSGDWVHIPDFSGVLASYRPVGPDPHPPFFSPIGLNLLAMFQSAGRPFVFGSRATACPASGAIYVSFSGGLGGTAMFRVNPFLNAYAHLLNIDGPQGLQDLTVGPSSQLGMSVYFTLHDAAGGSEQIHELSVPECPGGRVRILILGPGNGDQINSRSNARLTVAILGSPGAAVSAIDPGTVRFGPAGAAPDAVAVHDANGDTIPDLVLEYRARDTGLSAGDTQVCLTAALRGGGEILGCQPVRVR